MAPILVIALGVFILAACTEEQVKDSAGIAARSLCVNSRQCTLHDPKPD